MNHLDNKKLPELIALVGLDGVGKGYLADYLVKECNYLALGASDVLRQVIDERPELKGLPVDNVVLRIKEELGATIVTDKAINALGNIR